MNLGNNKKRREGAIYPEHFHVYIVMSRAYYNTKILVGQGAEVGIDMRKEDDAHKSKMFEVSKKGRAACCVTYMLAICNRMKKIVWVRFKAMKVCENMTYWRKVLLVCV